MRVSGRFPAGRDVAGAGLLFAIALFLPFDPGRLLFGAYAPSVPILFEAAQEIRDRSAARRDCGSIGSGCGVG